MEWLAGLLHALQELTCTRQGVNDIDQHRAQADQCWSGHLTFEVWTEGMRDGSDDKIPSCEHEDLSSVLKAHIKKLGGVANDFNPNTGEVELSRLLRLSGHLA